MDSCVRSISVRNPATTLSLRSAPARSACTAWPCCTSVWCNWSCVAQPATAPTMAVSTSKHFVRAARSVNDIGAAILAVTIFILAGCKRLFRTIADGTDSAAVHAGQLQCTLHRFGTPGAQCKIVFAAAAFVAVALDFRFEVGVCLQISGIGHQDRIIFFGHRRLVVTEIDAALERTLYNRFPAGGFFRVGIGGGHHQLVLSL